ncbi:serine hydrolase [Streptomyces sp. TRM68367]|uniref:serine hydrolase n=1 Tax=Streptomyces sp. TRM68367 TaxID=2758415 RepID=UPI0037DD1B02
MTGLHATLRPHVDDGTVPGAVGLVARGDDVEAVAVGAQDADGTAPMARDSIFRIASLTKPVTAAAVPGLGLRRPGRRHSRRPVERPRPLRLGRWHRHHGAPRPDHTDGRGPPDTGGMRSPTPPPLMRGFRRYAAGA